MTTKQKIERLKQLKALLDEAYDKDKILFRFEHANMEYDIESSLKFHYEQLGREMA